MGEGIVGGVVVFDPGFYVPDADRLGICLLYTSKMVQRNS